MKTQKSKIGSPKQHTQSARRSTQNLAPHEVRKQYRAAYPVHKRLLLHPLSMFLFLCVGVFMGGWTYQVVAATIISSTVEAPPLKTQATISAPQTALHTTSPTVTVSGECPATSYVSLTVNGSYSGTAMCASNNAYDITSSLYPGSNNLKVQDYNITDAPGPATDPIQVTYDAPALPVTAPNTVSTSTTGSSTSKTTPSATSTNDSGAASSDSSSPATDTGIAPILLTSNFQFHTFTSQQAFDWTMDLEGGAPPYVVSVDWGDGTSSTLRFPQDPVFHIHHDYTTPGYYPVIVKSVDSVGESHVMQLAALITNTEGQASFLGPTGGTDTGASSAGASSNVTARQTIKANIKWLFLAWPTYLILILMTMSFWLGERRELLTLIHIKPRRRTKRLA